MTLPEMTLPAVRQLSDDLANLVGSWTSSRDMCNRVRSPAFVGHDLPQPERRRKGRARGFAAARPQPEPVDADPWPDGAVQADRRDAGGLEDHAARPAGAPGRADRQLAVAGVAQGRPLARTRTP